jgi:hypothetical protein
MASIATSVPSPRERMVTGPSTSAERYMPRSASTTSMLARPSARNLLALADVAPMLMCGARGRFVGVPDRCQQRSLVDPADTEVTKVWLLHEVVALVVTHLRRHGCLLALAL